MKEIVLNDNELRNDLYPFALTRHVADIRIGILTIREKWELLLNHPIVINTEKKASLDNVLILPSNIIPTKDFFLSLEQNTENNLQGETCKVVEYPWHLFQFNDWALRKDFELLTLGKISAAIPESVQVSNPRNIFIEEGALLSHCILNASLGPIYIGKNAEIMEGTIIRGPVAICEGVVVKIGTRIYGATTIGPYSVVGGEIKNSIFFGYSNKAHDGYLGDSVVGEWCNLGAGTSNSNLKNNAGEVNVWNPVSEIWRNAGMKCGLLMGDYSRSAINTSFNTGTVVGVCCNVFGEGLTPGFIPGFSWGYKPLKKYEFEKAIRDITNWKKLKGKSVTEEEVAQLRNIFNQS
jgi:UDP-N-acetylglucosamine diphosphorylase/glucosamine-1-phosphate N-acetyltransferase